MKKMKLLYLLPLLTVTLAGCGKEKVEETDPNVINFLDFEGWGAGYQTIVLQNNFGRVSRNTDANFVKEGKESALLQPLGNSVDASKKPAVYWPLVSDVFDYNYSDLSYFQKVEFDVFNSSSEDIVMTAGFVASVTTIVNVAYGKGEDFTLKAGEWNHLVYEPDISKLATYITLTEAKGFYLMFPNARTSDVEKAPKIYVDGVKIFNSPTKRVIKDIFKIKPLEICDFEDEAAYNHISINNITPDHLSFEVVGETDGVKPTSGKKMLHVLNKGVSGRWVSWSKLQFSGAYIAKTDMATLPVDEVSAGLWSMKYEIRYDDHGLGLSQGSFFPEFFSKTGDSVYIPKDDFSNNKWVTVEIPFNRDITYYSTQHVTVKTELITENDGFGWTIGNEIGDVDVYIDNIRLVKRAA